MSSSSSSSNSAPASAPSLSDLHSSLSILQPSLFSLTTSLSSLCSQSLSDTQHHQQTSKETLKTILSFLHNASNHRRNSLPASTQARDNSEIQALFGSLFASLSRTEGVAKEGVLICGSSLKDISLFRHSRVAPLLQSFSLVKEALLRELDEKITELEAARISREEAIRALGENRESIQITSKHLDQIQDRLNSMAYQMEELAERKMELEMKKQEQKQRRQASGSNHALSFLSVFSPVIAPVASAVSAFASASENELRRLIAQIDSLRKQTLELNPASIEIALKDLNAEHQALHLSMESASSHFSAMESEKSAIEVQLIEIEKVHETLDKVCGEIADVQKEVADTEAMVMDAGERAGKAKMIAVMAVGEMSRMGYEQNKRKARGTVREVVEVVRDLELMGLLGKVKGSDDEDSQMDEGIGSSGEDAMTEVEEIDLGLVEDGDIEILEERRDTGLTSGEIDLDIIEEEEEEEQEDSDRESIEDEPFTPLLRKESFDRDDVVSVRDLEEEAFVTGRAQGLAIEDAYAEQQPEATTSVQPSTPVGIEVPEEDIPQLSITITDTTPNAVTVATQTENDSIAESYDEDMFHSPMMGPQSVVLGEDGSSVHRAVPGGFPSSPRKLSMEVVEKKSVVEVREVVLEFA